ncbi:MAG: PCRF domain-containing protein, partial [Eubacteriales bacterium]|nr:PCRF domain-containing protein [Eubacteriales bacterium]
MDVDQYSKLTTSEGRYEELTELLLDTELMRDQQAYIKLVKEHAELQPLVQLIRELRRVKETLSENKELLRETDDA